MGLTLLEAKKMMTGEVIRPAIIELFARASDILRVLPFINIQGNAYKYNREEALPGVAFRGVNEGYTPSLGVINPVIESLYIMGGDLDVDRFIISTQGQGVRGAHENLKVKALAAEFTRVYFKGDASSNPREFDGLQRRVAGSQLIENGNTAGGDPLSLLKLDEAIDAVDSPMYLAMNKATRRRLTAAARDQAIGGQVSFDRDEFGRQITKYNDLPIITAYSSNGGTDPLQFDEVGGGGGTAQCTSVYVLSYGDATHAGIQNAPMDVRDLGEMQSLPVMRTRVEWYPGIATFSPRSVSRLRGITNAAAVK